MPLLALALYLPGEKPQLPLASANGPGIICPFIFGALAPNSDSLNYISLRRIERAKAPERESCLQIRWLKPTAIELILPGLFIPFHWASAFAIAVRMLQFFNLSGKMPYLALAL
jgi:hypothetical protein